MNKNTSHLGKSWPPCSHRNKKFKIDTLYQQQDVGQWYHHQLMAVRNSWGATLCCLSMTLPLLCTCVTHGKPPFLSIWERICHVLVWPHTPESLCVTPKQLVSFLLNFPLTFKEMQTLPRMHKFGHLWGLWTCIHSRRGRWRLLKGERLSCGHMCWFLWHWQMTFCLSDMAQISWDRPSKSRIHPLIEKGIRKDFKSRNAFHPMHRD